MSNQDGIKHDSLIDPSILLRSSWSEEKKALRVQDIYTKEGKYVKHTHT